MGTLLGIVTLVCHGSFTLVNHMHLEFGYFLNWKGELYQGFYPSILLVEEEIDLVKFSFVYKIIVLRIKKRK